MQPLDTVTSLVREYEWRGDTMTCCVMDDGLRELRRHLPILTRARGRVLVTGLGLGCVLRGLLAKPEVEHVDVVEIDPAIAQLVWCEFEHNRRVSLHLGDALTIKWPAHRSWDYAWHDVWTPELERLDVLHVHLLARYRDRVPNGHQGAWQLARVVKRVWPDALLNQGRAVRSTKGADPKVRATFARIDGVSFPLPVYQPSEVP